MFEAHSYQAATQCGYYGYNIAPFKNYLHYFKENPTAIFPPKSANVSNFDSSLNQKVQEWLEVSGNNLIYIYGGNDTWTAAGIMVSNKVNSKKFVIPQTNHATARIKNMDIIMQQEFRQIVKQLIDLNITFEAVK